MSWYQLLPPHLRDRLTLQRRISQGAQGEVWCALDEELNREVAVKVLRALDYEDDTSRRTERVRFQREVRVSARLDHPGILPVYDHAILGDGRPMFVMRLVEGERTLDRAHPGAAASAQDQRRRVSALVRVCEALAHAHARGIVHRDVKPANILVASTGEIYVADWGLARLDGSASDDEPSWETDRALTLIGAAGGTPGWMSPEAARGGLGSLTPAADVYGLCAVLYQLLTGSPPQSATTLAPLLEELSASPLRPLPDTIPDDLRQIVTRGLSHDPKERPAHAGVLAAQLSDWLDGVQRRERATTLLHESAAARAQVASMSAEAAALRLQGEVALRDLPTWAPVEERRPAWQALEQAERLERDVRLEQVQREQRLRAALELAPDLDAAREDLAAMYADRLVDAERSRRWSGAEEAAAQLQGIAGERYATLLSGEGWLTLVTDPPGASVEVMRYVEEDHRLVPVPDRVLGPTPIVDARLPMGSYLLLIRAPGREVVRYPVYLTRCGRWDGVPPGAQEPHPVWLPPTGAIGPDERYVPAGWFLAGDSVARGGLSEMRLWVPSFCIQTNPVTNAEYLNFLNALLADGREDEASACAPRELGNRRDQPGAPVFRIGASARFEIFPDVDGDRWHPDWPVVLVDFASARSFALWRSEATGQRWRLPMELEWEKAARGVDGRTFPWGDRDETTFASLAGSRRTTKNLPSRVSDFELDESPYGARHVAGLARTWCMDLFYHPSGQTEGPLTYDPQLESHSEDYRTCRGGAWNAGSMYARCGYRMGLPPHSRLGVVGCRLVRVI